ncbi:MAG: site-specific DNA-methyltransferase [Nocardioidaceae bacterium]|nr:site-specific DNA-methyltransferase [Nocardioidaceae bacterium]
MAVDHPAGLPRGQILTGDAATHMATLPSSTIDTIVTSPPYFRLRDYNATDQIGLEASVDEWVSDLQVVTRQAERLLVPTGTLWLNLGDAYSTHPREGAPRKSLLGAPERLLLALIEDGWVVRNKVIWAKSNPIPSSVTDRLSCTYEVVYSLTRRAAYFFDLHAIRTPHTSRPKPRLDGRGPKKGTDKLRPTWLGPNADGDSGLANLHRRGLAGHPLGKNPGDVWTISTSRYRGAHFATYPPALVERILRAACPEQRCVRCRTPWSRPIRRLGATATRLALRPDCHCHADHESGLVLDPFMGAGTTAVAAEALGRDWMGIELNPEYVALANHRIASTRPSNQSKGGDYA